MSQFKIHMIMWAEAGEGFRTVCGIDDGCSEKFWDSATLTVYGDTKKTTCKKCLAAFYSQLKREEKEMAKIKRTFKGFHP